MVVSIAAAQVGPVREARVVASTLVGRLGRALPVGGHGKVRQELLA
jgi:hypothetical protein